MFKDIVNEQLVARKFGKKEMLKTFAFTLGFFFLLIAIYIIMAVIGGDIMMLLMVVGLLTWGAVALLKRMIIIEHEYLVVNGDMTIDKIANRIKRKRVLTLDLKNVDRVGKYTAQVKNEIKHDIFKNCSDSDNPARGLYFCFNSHAGQRVLLLVSPNKKMRDAIKMFIPPRVMREGFPGGDFSDVYPE